MAKLSLKRLVVVLERCDAIAPMASSKAKPRLSRLPRVELVDCLSLPKSLGKICRKLRRPKRTETVGTAEVIAACDSELPCDAVDTIQNEESPETSVVKTCSVMVEPDVMTPTSEDDPPQDSAEPDGKTEAPEQVCVPERLSLFDQMPLLLMENDDFFPAPEDPLLVDPASLLLGSGEVLVVETGSRNSSILGEYPPAEFFHELNNDVMLGDVANRSTLLEEEELLVPGVDAVTMETSAVENVEFSQNDFAIDVEMDWNCEQPWPLLESGGNLPEGQGLLNSSLDAGDSDDEFEQRMREEFLARRLRCSTRLQNQQRVSAERSLSESDNLESDTKIVVRKRNREVPNLDVPNSDVQDEVVQKKSKMRRIHSKSSEKIVPNEPTASEVEPAGTPTTPISDNLDGESNQSNSKEIEGLRQKKVTRKDRPSTEAKARTIQTTTSLLTSQNEAENARERKNSFRTSMQPSDDGKSLRKSVDIPAEEASSAKKPSSKAKENKGVPERVTVNDVKLSKSLLNSVEAAKLKYMLLKKEREANEPKEMSAEEKAKNAKDVCKNPCREPGCSAPAWPGSIFCSPECLSRHVEESIKLLAQDRLKTYNRDQQPGNSGISDAAKAAERIVVFERKTGKLVTGPLAPTESSLLAWLQRHPTFEVLQPEQALGHVTGNLNKRKKKPMHGGRRNGAEPSAVTRVNLSGASSDRTQKNSGTEAKLGLLGKSQAAATNAKSTSNNASLSREQMDADEHLDPLRSNTRSELRHLLLERFDRNVSAARVKRLVIEIECELWSASRGSSSMYKQKFSGLVRMFKRPSGQDLCRRLLCAELKPRQLLQQMRELQRSETGITKSSTVNPLDLLPGLIDTTERHGEHIFDVGCRICSGTLTRTTESECSQPPTLSDATCNNKTSSDLDQNTLKPEVSLRLENNKGIEGDGGNSEAIGIDTALTRKTSEFVIQEVERPSGETVSPDTVSTVVSPTVSSCVDSKHSDKGQSSTVVCNRVSTTSQDFLPSVKQSTTIVPSPEISSRHLPSDVCSSSISPSVLSPTLTTSSVSSQQLATPVQTASCKSSSGHHLPPSNIPSGYLTDVPAPSVALPAGQPTPCPLPPSVTSSADLITNVEQVPFVTSPASTQTSAPCTSLSACTSSSLTVTMRHSSVDTKLSSVPTRTPVAMRHSSAEMVLPSKHSVTDVRPASEGSSSATLTSRPQGSSRTTSTSSGGHDAMVDMVWKGSVSALDGATMQLCAYRTSGSMKIVRSVLPATVTVMGRIDPKTVEDYLQKIRQQYTATREIAVICFHCHDDGDKVKYNQLFNYLQERRRCGVIGSISSAIKDMYIWPLPASAPIPTVLLPFNGPGLNVNRCDVLLGIVIQQATRSRGQLPKQTTSTTPQHNTVVAAKSTKVEPAPATAQDNLTPSSELKNESGASPTNGESSDEVSDDDLKAFAQADPIVSKYSKARPQDLLVKANTEGDKPYDPFDEDYEMDSAAQNQSKPEAELHAHQKVTEFNDHSEDVSPKPRAPRKTSETTSDVHQQNDDHGSRDSSAKDATQETNESVGAQNTQNLDILQHDRGKTEADRDVVVIGKYSDSIKSPKSSTSLSSTSKKSQKKSTKAVVCTETGEVPTMSTKQSTHASCTNEFEKNEGSVTTGSSAVGTTVGQPSTAQAPEASNPDSAETLTSIATILTQLSEKNALNQDILRSLLDQLLSVYGAQNDRDQRAILLQLVETIEKQHSVTEKQESVTETQKGMTEQGVTEQQQVVAKNERGEAGTLQSLTNMQESVTKQNVAKMQTGKGVAVEAVPDGGAQTKALIEACHQPAGVEGQAVNESRRAGNQFNTQFVKERSLDSRREVAPSDDRNFAHQVTLEERQTGDCKALVPPGERGPWNFQKHFPGEEGRTEDNVKSRSSKDVIDVPGLSGECVDIWKHGLLGKAAVDRIGPKAEQGQNVSPRFGLICPEFSVFQQGNESLAQSEYPAMYSTDIQSHLSKDKPTQPARCEDYDTGWFSAPHRREPIHSVWDSEKGPRGLDPKSRVPVEDGSLYSGVPPLRSCLKKRKPEMSIDEPGIDIEKILPVLSDSSFETLKSIVMSAKSAGVVSAQDPARERQSQVHAEDQDHRMTTKNSLDVSTDASFWSPPSFTHPLSSPPFPIRPSPERPLFSPTFSNPGRLPAPPKPPPYLLQGTQIRASIPEAFANSQLPNAQRTCPPHPGFQSPPMFERVDPCRRINAGGVHARLAFSPPWVPEDPSNPAGHSRWLGSALPGLGGFPGRPSCETAMENWSYPFDNPRQRGLAAESRPFWQSNFDTEAVMQSQNSSSHGQCMADERARGMMSNAVAREDFTGKEMIERNFGHCPNNRSRLPNMETVSPQPLFPHDQDYRPAFCDSSTKSLIDSTYNDREFRENSYEFFGSILEDGGNFENLGELLPGLGALETTDFSERTVDLCDYPSSQADKKEKTAEFEYGQDNNGTGKLETFCKTEINQVLAASCAKTDMLAKTEIAKKSETSSVIGGDLKASLTDHSNLNISDNVCVKTEFVACTSTETTSLTESSAESEMTVKTSPSPFDCKSTSGSNKDIDSEAHCDQALSETSQKTICSSDVIKNETASEHDNRGADEGDNLAQTLATLNALIERCAKPESELKSQKASDLLLQVFDSSNKTTDEARLINDVSDLLRRCLDSNLLSYSDICGLSLPVLVEKGTLADDKPLAHVEMSCSESLGVNGELESCLSSGIRPDASTESLSRSEGGQHSSNSFGLHLTEDPKPHEVDSDSNTATHISESDDCVINRSSNDSKMQWDDPCSGDLLQIVVDRHQATTESTPDRDVDSSRVSSDVCHERGASVKVLTDGRAFRYKSQTGAESCDSSDGVETRRGRHDSRKSSKRHSRDSYSSCDSPEKQRHRHDSCDGSEKQRNYQNLHDSKQSYHRDSSESGNYPRHRDSSSGSTAKRKRSRDSSGRTKKRSRCSRDSDEEREDLFFSSDELEKQDRTHNQRATIYSRDGSYQSSESDNQRVLKKAATSFVSMNDDKRFMGTRSSRDRRPEISNGSHRDNRRDGIRYTRTRSPSDSSDRTATSNERRRERVERSGGNRSAAVEERSFHKMWKVIENEERFNEEQSQKRSRRLYVSSQDRNGDREERCRRMERTRDPRSENRHKEDALGSKRNDAETAGLAAFAGFISRRIPVEVDNEIPWSKDQTDFIDALHGAPDSKNLKVMDWSKVMGGLMGLDRNIRPSLSRDCEAGQTRRHDEQLQHPGSLVIDAVAKSLTVASTSGRELMKSFSNRDGRSSELKQSVYTEPVHANGREGTRSGQETADRRTGHFVIGGWQEPGGQLLPNGQQTQMVQNLCNASNGRPAPNPHGPQLNNVPPRLSGPHRTHATPKKQPVKVSTEEELEEGEIVDAPEPEWPSATRDLLALLNAPKSWVSPSAGITNIARQQPGPSKT